MNSDGSDQTRLTQNLGKDVLPAWSPDGTKIAFFSDREVGDGLYVMNFDGSEQKPLSTIPPDNKDHSYQPFSWSPDGKKIVFATFYNYPLDHLSIISLDTLSQVKLTTSPGENDAKLAWSLQVAGHGLYRPSDVGESNPVWSPDGSKIAFSRFYIMRSDDGSSFGFTDGPFVVDTDGNNEIKVFEDDIKKYGPLGHGIDSISWSPDSSKILFGLDRGVYFNLVLVVELGSLNSHKITRFGSEDFNPVWSPDGSEIAFWALAPKTYEIFLANTDGTHVHQLSELNVKRGPISLNWSADGKKLAFTYMQYPGNSESNRIYVIDVETGELVNLSANEQYADYDPVWSP